jgi:4-alpha-glucanotransferase
MFERGEDGRFLPKDRYPAQAVVTGSTHDLPTLAGWWAGQDIAWRQRLGFYPEAAVHEQTVAERRADRMRLLRLIAETGLLPGDVSVDDPPAVLTPELGVALQAFLAETPSEILMVQLEDAVLELEQPNLPGTTAEHPNWRRRLGTKVDELFQHPQVRALAAALRQRRPGCSGDRSGN